MSVLSIQTRRIDGLTEATTAEDEDLLLIRKADGTGTRNIKKKNLIPKTVDKVGDMNLLRTSRKDLVTLAINELYFDLSDVKRISFQTHEDLQYVMGSGYLYSPDQACGNHNALYRRRGLGTLIRDEQIKAIRDGTFRDMYVGDCWGDEHNFYTIAHFDYFPIKDHHVVLICDFPEGKTKFSTYDPSKKETYVYKPIGYRSSEVRKYIEGTFKQNIGCDLRKCLKDVAFPVTDRSRNNPDGNELTSDWITASVGLPTVEMLTGLPSNWSGVDSRGLQFGQLSLFQHNRRMIMSEKPYWLDNMIADDAAVVYDNGYFSTSRSTRNEYAVRPFIVIG